MSPGCSCLARDLVNPRLQRIFVETERCSSENFDADLWVHYLLDHYCGNVLYDASSDERAL